MMNFRKTLGRLIPQTTFAALLLALLTSFGTSATEKTTDVSTETPANFEQAFSQVLNEKKIPGAQLVLFNDNAITESYSFGFRNVDENLKVEHDTVFRGGSTTKTLIALAIEVLVQQGKLSLNDTLDTHAPEIAITNPYQDEHPVRIIHLLEHTAGLDDMHFKNFYNTSEPEISLLDAVNRDRNALIVRWQPGLMRSYSNPGYGVLGFLIEKISNEPYETFIQNNILMPLGMKNSTLHSPKSAEQQLSQGYVNDKAVVYKDIYLRSAGSLNTTAEDLAKLGQYLLSRGRSASILGISELELIDMEKPQSTDAGRKGLNYGYGRGIYSSTRGDSHWKGHNGGIDGFTTFFGYSSYINKGFALTVNSSTSSMREPINLLIEHLTKDADPIKAIPVGGIDPAISGYYRMVNNRNQIFAGLLFPVAVIHVSIDGNEVILKEIIGSTERYQHIGGQLFAGEGQAHAKLIFLKEGPLGKAIDLEGSYLVETNVIFAWLPLIALAIIIFVLLLTLLYAPVWLVNTIRGRLPLKSQKRLRVFPLLCLISLGFAFFALMSLSPNTAGAVNWQTITIFVASVLFLVFALLAVYQARKSWQDETSKAAKTINTVAAISSLLLALYLWYFDYIGLRLWTW